MTCLKLVKETYPPDIYLIQNNWSTVGSKDIEDTELHHYSHKYFYKLTKHTTSYSK